MSNYQHHADPTSRSNLAQTELYTTYAERFSPILPDSTQPSEGATELQDFEANMATPAAEFDMSFASDQSQPVPLTHQNRLLNPVELITLARMTFPKCEPSVDPNGRFVIKGLERRDAMEKGRNGKVGDMFPFALTAGQKIPYVSRYLADHCLHQSRMFQIPQTLSHRFSSGNLTSLILSQIC